MNLEENIKVIHVSDEAVSRFTQTAELSPEIRKQISDALKMNIPARIQFPENTDMDKIENVMEQVYKVKDASMPVKSVSTISTNNLGVPRCSLIGTPFEPSLDANWEEVPMLFLRRYDSKFKSIYNRNYRASKGYLLEEIKEDLVDRVLGGSIGDAKLSSNINAIELQNFYSRVIKSNLKIQSKKANRYFKRELIPYEAIMYELLDTKPSELISDKVFKIGNLKSLLLNTQNLFKDGLKLSCKGVLLARMVLSNDNQIDGIQNKYYLRIKAAGLESFGQEAISRVITLIENKIQLKNSILALWTISRMLNDERLFMAVYATHKDAFDKSAYPFLNFTILDAAESAYNEIGPDGVTPMEDRFNHVFLSAVSSIYNSNMSTPDKVANLKLEITKECYDDLGKPDISAMVKQNSEGYDKVKASLSSILGDTNPTYKSFIKQGRDFVNNLSLLNSVQPDYAACVNISERVNNTFMGLVEFLEENTTEFIANEKSILALNSEAKLLGEDPLNNLDKLFELKLELQHGEEKQKSLRDTVPNVVGSHLVYITATTEALLNLLQSLQGKEVNLKHGHAARLEDEVKTLEAELESAYYEIGHQKQKITNLNAKLSHTNREVEAPAPVDLSPEILSILENKNDIATIFAVVNKLNPGKMLLSSKAPKSIKAIKQFKNFALLFNKLSILVSDDFTTAYSTEGSVKAFSFLSRNELAFQESESVKKKKIRSYKFDDYGELDCKAHIKVGIDNSEQHMLRVYFTIQHGKVLIGEVTRHLPCS